MHRFFFSTGLVQMHFVPHPFGVPLAALAGIRLIGRYHPLGIANQRAIPPAHHVVDPLAMFVPHLLPEGQPWGSSDAMGSPLVHRCSQQMPAIFSYLPPPASVSR